MGSLAAYLGTDDHSACDLGVGNTGSTQGCGESGMVGKVAWLVTRTHFRLLFETSVHIAQAGLDLLA